MRIPIVSLCLMLALAGCGNQALDYGDFRYPSRPRGCIIYVDFTDQNSTNIDNAIPALTKKHDFHPPGKEYQAYYSGPGVADYLNKHVAIYNINVFGTNHIRLHVLADCLRGNKLPRPAIPPSEPGVYPVTTIGFEMVVHDTNYSTQEFKQLSEAFAASMRASFPMHSVKVIYCDELATSSSTNGLFQEPSYKGRTLTQWLKDYQKVSGGSPHVIDHTIDPTIIKTSMHAVREIGTNAIPFLLEKVSTKRRVDKYLGMVGFKILGNDAISALPTLAELTKHPDGDVRWQALGSLFYIKPRRETVLPILLQTIHDPEKRIRSVSTGWLALKEMYPEEAEKAGVYEEFPDLKPRATDNPPTNAPVAK